MKTANVKFNEKMHCDCNSTISIIMNKYKFKGCAELVRCTTDSCWCIMHGAELSWCLFLSCLCQTQCPVQKIYRWQVQLWWITRWPACKFKPISCQATVVCRQATRTGVEIKARSFRDAWKHREIQRSDACSCQTGICWTDRCQT